METNIFVLILSLILIYTFKPNIIFKPNSKPREHGVGVDSEGYNKTLYSMFSITIFLCVIIYILF